MPGQALTTAVVNETTKQIIAACMEVHSNLGPGLLESVYEECVVQEMIACGLQFERQIALPVVYKGRRLEGAYRLDLVVENSVVVELKAVEALLPIHQAQLLTYLKLTSLHVGLLINFNVPSLRLGIKRVVHPFKDSSAPSADSAALR